MPRKRQKTDRLLIYDLSQLDTPNSSDVEHVSTMTNMAGRTQTVITSISPLNERESMPPQAPFDLNYGPYDEFPSLYSNNSILESTPDPQVIQVLSQTCAKYYENSVREFIIHLSYN